MGTLHVILLALVQALTEFLPVSSSGHIVLAGELCGMPRPGILLELILHVGTLAAVCVFYRRRIAFLLGGLVRREKAARLYAVRVLISMLPAAALFFLAGDFLERSHGSPRIVAFLLILNGAFLLASGLKDRSDVKARKTGRGDGCAVNSFRALIMGVGQAIAVFPGISRSGTSIMFGRLAGAGPGEAAEFSFLMSVPVIAGGAVLEAVSSLRETGSLGTVSAADALAGVAVSGVVGYFALKFLVRILDAGRFWIFGIYCLLAGSVFTFMP